MSPSASVPIAPALRTSAPSLASVSAVPPAEPAAVDPDLLDERAALALGDLVSTGRTSTSSTCTPMATPSCRLIRSCVALRARAP